MSMAVLIGFANGAYAQNTVKQLEKYTLASAAAAITAPAPGMSVEAAGQIRTVCFELSRDGVFFSRTPEKFCVEEKKQSGAIIPIKVVLGLDEMGRFRKVAEFDLELLQRAKCMDCNQDVYGISNPSNTLFNELVIKFDGTRSVFDGNESGSVSIGTMVFKYRSIPR